MHFDALTLACMADELRSPILGGRVQQVLLPDADSVGLEVYAQRERRYLLISAQAGAGRVLLSGVKLRRGAGRGIGTLAAAYDVILICAVLSISS